MDYHALVVGGGHAGIETGLALSRIGFKTLLITQNLDAIGRLSCNPAIGGLSKGNIVREVDALGGEMAHYDGRSMIQFRILNRKRSPAVQAPQAQADKYAYARLAKETLEGQANLEIFMDTVVDLIIERNRIVGVKTKRGHTPPRWWFSPPGRSWKDGSSSASMMPPRTAGRTGGDRARNRNAKKGSRWDV